MISFLIKEIGKTEGAIVHDEDTLYDHVMLLTDDDMAAIEAVSWAEQASTGDVYTHVDFVIEVIKNEAD